MFGQVRLDARCVRHALLDGAQLLAGDGRLNRAVHAPPGPVVRGVVERADGAFDDRCLAGRRRRAARRAQRLLDARAFRVVEQIGVAGERLVGREQDARRLHLRLTQAAQLEVLSP